MFYDGELDPKPDTLENGDLSEDEEEDDWGGVDHDEGNAVRLEHYPLNLQTIIQRGRPMV